MKLKAKFTLIVSISVVTIVVLTAFFGFSHYKKSIEEMIAQQQFLMISALADEFDSKLLSAQQDLIAVAKASPPDIMQKPEKAQAFLDNRVILHRTFDGRNILFTPSGKIFVESPYAPGRRGFDLSFRKYIINTLKTKKPYISDPFLSSLPNKHPVIVLTVPLFDYKGKITGILAGSIDLMRDNFLERISTLKVGKTGNLYLYQDDGTIIMHPNKKRILVKQPRGLNRLFDMAGDGFEGTGETTTSYGLKVVASFKRLKTKNWILAANYPQAEAYLPIQKAKGYFLIATIIAVLVVFFVISFIIKYLTNPLELFTRHVEALPQKTGNDRFLDIKTEDEIGTLSLAFNKMVTEIDKRSALERSEELYRTVIEFSTELVYWRAPDQKVLYISENCEKFCGYTEDEFYASPEILTAIIHPDDRNIWAEHTHNIDSKGILEDLELRMMTKSGQVRWISHTCLPVYDKKGTYSGRRGSHQDITERKQAEEALIRARAELELRVEERTEELSTANAALQSEISERKHREELQRLARVVLEGLNQLGGTEDTIRDILQSIKQITGFEAVGIRLRKGDDFPYFVQDGFSTDFLLTENTLTVRDADGCHCKNEEGKTNLECTCGLVISGHADPADTYFTPNGSYWTNDSVALPDLPSDRDPRLKPRNRCVHEGFHSIALMPLRAGKDIVGLLQLNARRKNQFTLEMIQFFEGLCSSIGISLARKLAEDGLKEALNRSERLTQEISALLEASNVVLENRGFEPAARAIFDECKKLLGATAGYVALLSSDEAENEVLFLDSGGRPCSVDPHLPMPIRGLREKAYKTGKTVYDNNFCNSDWMQYIPEGHVALDNVMFTPLNVYGKVVGVIGLANKPGGFNDNDARLATGFGETAAIALQNSRTLESLANSEMRLSSVVETATDEIISINAQGKIVLWNKGAEHIFGYAADEVYGKDIAFFIPPRYLTAHQQALNDLTTTGRLKYAGKALELSGLKKDATEFPIELTTAKWETTEGTFFTGIIRDITERKKAEEQIRFLATHDALTNLPTLRLAKDRILMSIEMAERNGKLAAIMYIDVDGFKDVNDTYGHDAGDVLLKEVGKRLLSCVRKVDTVARIGGDEFLLVITELQSPDGAELIAKHILQLMSKPFAHDGKRATVGVSIGIALYPDHGMDAESLIRQADKAMYVIKNSGKNRYTFASLAK